MLNRIAILIVSVATLGLLHLGGVIPTLSDKALDTLFLLRGPIQPSEDIVIIGVDEESLAELGAWPFPRRHHAELLQRLHQAKAIGFDILFSEPTIEDEQFSAAIAAAPPVVLATAHSYQHRILKPARSLSGYSSLGHVEINLSRDGVVRKSNIFQQSGDSVIPAFSAAILQSVDSLEELRSAEEPILINHYGPEISFLYLSYLDVLSGAIPDLFFKDRFVLIGAEALGIGDSHITPFSSKYPIPGVEIQATILNNLLDNSSLKKLLWPIWLLMATIGLIGIFLWPVQGERRNWIINTSLSVAILISSFIFFRVHLFFDPVVPLLFLSINFALYLVMERIWTAKKIFKDMRRLDRQLETQLQRIYTNIPNQFFNLHPAPQNTSGIKRHLAHLQAGVNVLSLQHHFIENILREELLPLILWDKTSGIVILANTTFNTFWQNQSAKHSSLPTLEQFTHLLNENQLSEIQNRIDSSALLQDNTIVPAIDISLTEQGLERYFRVNMQLFKIADLEFSGVMATLTDVTEIKELERLKDKIVSVVSHELKLPLTVILGYGEMLADSLQGEKKKYIDEICSQTERLNRLIEEFLDVARIEHNRQEIKRLPLDLIQLIQEAEDTVLIPAEKKSITIQSQLPFKATPIIGDHSLLFQAIINLLDNAIKFSPIKTQVTITLTEEVDKFFLSVSDQGPGVPLESQDEIFESFNRGQGTLSEKGFGLGLSFVKQVVQKHQGQLWLEPKEDIGACFCFTLPKHPDS